MSFLDQLKNTKKCLRHSSTTVTQANGQRFIENTENGQLEIIPQKSVAGFVIDTKPDRIPALIIPHLYVGSQDCCELSVIENYNIKNILSVGIEPFCKFPNVCYQFVECLDLPETDLDEIMKLICVPYIKRSLDNNENILIHCNAGCSRSPSIAIGFLMLEFKYKFMDAFNLLKNKRPSIQINSGFYNQLKALDEEMR